MTSPIAGSSRPIPDVAPAAMQDHASTNASNPTNGGTFRSALENAMNDKPAATPTRAPARARREQGITRQAGVRDSRDGARAAEGQSANAGATQGETASWDRAPSSPVDLQESVTPRDESALALTLGISDRAKDLPVPSIVVDPTLVLALGGDRPVGRIDAASTRPDAKASNADGDVSPMIDQQALAAQFVEAAIGDVAAALNAAPSATNSGAASAALAGATAAAAGTNLPNVSSAASAIVDTRAADTPAVVRRSTDALVPDLRLRLDRVIDRMKSEFGYSVEVVETVRSQARQDELFAQGRSAPGEVVTWTRNSKHTAGRAVDVVIDGSYENAAAYRDLAQVAREEGLRSLWPRDGGHLEIAGAATHTDLPLPASADGNAANGASTRTVPALPVQARAGIDVESLLDGVVSPANIKSRLDELAPSIPTLSRIPSSAAELVLPRASGREQLRQSFGSGHDSNQTNSSPFQDPNAGRLTKMPVDASGAPSRDGMAQVAPVVRVAQVAQVAQVARVGNVANVAQVVQVARVADVVPVARVANVAPVATVAQGANADQTANTPQVARASSTATTQQVAAASRETAKGGVRIDERGHGIARPAVGSEGTDSRESTIAAAVTTTTAKSDADSSDAERHSSGDKRERGRESAVAPTAHTGDDLAIARSIATGELGSDASKGSSSGDAVAGLARSDATERIARVLKVQEAAGDRPLTSVLLRLDSPDGGEDRVRIGLRGNSVGASFDVSDNRAAENLRTHTNELQQALQRQGLEGESITIRSTQRSTEPVSLGAAVMAEREGGRVGSTAASDGGGSTAKDSRNQPHADDWREGASQQRSRQQRRDSKENR